MNTFFKSASAVAVAVVTYAGVSLGEITQFYFSEESWHGATGTKPAVPVEVSKPDISVVGVLPAQGESVSGTMLFAEDDPLPVGDALSVERIDGADLLMMFEDAESLSPLPRAITEEEAPLLMTAYDLLPLRGQISQHRGSGERAVVKFDRDDVYAHVTEDGRLVVRPSQMSSANGPHIVVLNYINDIEHNAAALVLASREEMSVVASQAMLASVGTAEGVSSSGDVSLATFLDAGEGKLFVLALLVFFSLMISARLVFHRRRKLAHKPSVRPVAVEMQKQPVFLENRQLLQIVSGPKVLY